MDQRVEAYIDKQPSPQKEICRKVRQIVLGTFPGIEERMKWGVPSYGNGAYYIVGLKNHVNVGFSIEGLSREEIELFDGGGETTKHLQIRSVNDIDRMKIVDLLKMVMERSGDFRQKEN